MTTKLQTQIRAQDQAELAERHNGTDTIQLPRGFVLRSELYAALRRLDAITEERDELRGQLETIIGASLATKIVAVGFAAYEARLLAALHARPFQPLSALIAADRYRSDDPVDVGNLIRVRVCSIRKRVRAMGGPADVIKTLRASGYRLSERGRAWLDQRMQEVAR